MRALLLSHDAETRRSLEAALAGAGFETAVRSDPDAAWRACRDEPFDVVILTRDLPDQDGLQLCRRIRDLPGGEHRFIVLVLAPGDSASRAELLEACADDIVVRPFDVERLTLRLAVAADRARSILDRARHVAQVTREALWEWDPGNDRVAWSETIATLFGHSAEQMGTHIDGWRDRIHPDDRERVLAGLAEALPGTQTTWNVEYRFLRGDGTYTDVFQRGYVDRDSGRRPCRVIAAMVDVSPWTRAEAAVRQAKEYTENLLDTANVMIVQLDAGGRVQLFNRASEEITGYTRAELEGRDWFEILMPPERYPGVWKQFTQLATGELPRTFEHPIVTKTGEERLIAWRNSDVRSEGRVIGSISFGIDVTERRRSEAALRESEARKGAILESALDSIVTMDHRGVITEFNPAAERIFRIRREEAVGRTVADVMIPPAAREAHWRGLARYLATGEGPVIGQRVEMIAQRPDGTEFPVEVAITRIEHEGPPFFTAYLRDLTERRKTESALLHAQKLESLGVLAGGIAHDFNNLLVGVLGNAGLALRELPESSPARKFVQQIETAGQRAAELTQQMLAYSGRGRFVVRRLDLNTLVLETVPLLEISIAKNVVLEYRLGTDLPAVEADPTQIRQVLMNLIANASEAIGERSGTVVLTTGRMQADRIYLAETYLAPNLPEGDYVYAEIMDTGSGMDAETRARIFEPFFTTKFTGRGLGLAAVLGIVRGHRGALKFYSEPGRGTTFRVLLPAATGTPSTLRESKPIEAAWGGSGTVLVVDDEASVRRVAAGLLEAAGFQVLEAADGLEGVATFRAEEARIVAVLLDMTMPRMSGAEAFREMRRIRPDLRVILTSGYNEADATERFGGGLAGFLQKPFTAAGFGRVLSRALASAPPV